MRRRTWARVHCWWLRALTRWLCDALGHPDVMWARGNIRCDDGTYLMFGVFPGPLATRHAYCFGCRRLVYWSSDEPDEWSVCHMPGRGNGAVGAGWRVR